MSRKDSTPDAAKPVPTLWLLSGNERISQLEKPKISCNCKNSARFHSVVTRF
jgi:hypothetical protein